MTTKTFNYTEWLQGLKVGDKVKTSACNHNRYCNCEYLQVTGLVEMFKEPCITVLNGCTLTYYSQKNGRELGARKGTYKNGNLVPFTEEDEKKLREKEEEARLIKAKEEKSEVLAHLLTSKEANDLKWDIKRHMELPEIEWAIDRIKGAKK